MCLCKESEYESDIFGATRDVILSLVRIDDTEPVSSVRLARILKSLVSLQRGTVSWKIYLGKEARRAHRNGRGGHIEFVALQSQEIQKNFA
jgi:hypothetical protein